MTYPITPNPSIHQQPKNIGGQNMVFTGLQLQQWAQQLPLAMTLQLMDAILKALGVSQSTIDSFNNQETAYYNAVQTELGTVNTDVAALQADSSASTAAFGTFLTSVESAITGYTNWSTFITAIENAWNTYSTTQSGLTSSAIFTLQNLFNTLLGLNPSTGQISGSNISSSTGLASLQADWNQWTTNVENTWDAFWNGIFGTSVTGKTASDVQTAATAVAATANTAQTTANTGNTNTGTFLGYTRVLSDVFHLIYPAGSPSDTPTTTIGGLPTWYSAWNGLLQLEGLVKSITPPTDTAPTTGQVIQANTAAATTAGTNASIAIASNQSVVDQVNQAMTGVTTTGQPLSSVLGNLTAIPASNIQGNTGATVTYGASGVGNYAGPATTASTSWSHTPATTDTLVDVFISYHQSTSGFSPSSSVTYGGAAMTFVKRVTTTAAAGASVGIDHYQIAVTPSGSPATATVAASATAANGSSYINGCSVSYYASKVLQEISNSGSSATTFSQSITSSTSKRVVAVFATVGFTAGQYGTVTGATQRYLSNVSGANQPSSLWIGDTAGTGSSQTISVSSGTSSSVAWVGLLVELSN